MPIQRRSVRDRTAKVPVFWEDQQGELVYARGRVTQAWWDAWGRESLASILSKVLVSWDYVDEDGKPIQPEPLENTDHWNEHVTSTRLAVALNEKQIKLAKEHQAKLEKAKGKNLGVFDPDAVELTEKEREEATKQPITADERLLVYQHHWNLILIYIDNKFLDACLTAILEDVRPGKSPDADSDAG